MSQKRSGHPAEPLVNGTAEKKPYETLRPNSILMHNGSKEISKGPYRVRKLPSPSHEEASISWSSPPLDSKFLRIVNLINVFVWLAYVFCEIIFVRALREATGQSMWQIWMAMATEFFIQFPEMIVSFEVLLSWVFGSTMDHEAPRYELLGDIAPTVDVMITCSGEDPQVVMDTVVAAATQDYPTDRYRVFVLDDAKSSEVKEMVEAFKGNKSNGSLPLMTYVARDKKLGVRHYYKAGNLHNGFDFSGKLGPGSEYFAALDADMITDTDWLRRIVPHLVVQDNLALACPPQHFYNIPANDPLCQDTYIFSRVSEPLKRWIDANSCAGSGYVLRRAALSDIGGLPLVDVGEDIILSALLLNAGWKNTFVDEHVQCGLAPDTYASYLKQRMRWTDGTMLLSRYFSYYLPWSSKLKLMTYGQKANEVLHILSKISTVFVTASLLALPISLWQAPYSWVSTNALIRIQRLLGATFAVRFFVFKTNRYLIFSRVGTTSVTSAAKARIWSAPYIAYRTLLSSIPGSDAFHFQSTGSLSSRINERSAKRRKSLPWRLLSLDMILRISYIFLMTPIVLTRMVQQAQGDYTSHFLQPLIGPLLRLVQCISSVSIPVLYMLFPPTLPERDQLIEKDRQGINRPRKSAVRGLKVDNNIWDTVFELGIILTCGSA